MSDPEENANNPEKPALRQANENPWYCLATLHGEQPAEGWNQQLAEKNLTAWNRWLDGWTSADERSFAERARPLSFTKPDPNLAVDFSHTRFDCPVNFSGFVFPRHSDFQSATFSHDVKFVGTAFNAATDFRSATFCGGADFTRAQFNSSGDFQSATFFKVADFAHVNSFSDANFSSATFCGWTDFKHSKFIGRPADFSDATFASFAEFESTAFVAGVSFTSAKFSTMVNFNAAKFNITSFNDATFLGHITFINAEFAGIAAFARARFDIQPPDFRGAKMHEATEWHGVVWPKPSKNENGAQDQVYAYERLKQEMERLKKHDDEQKFFRMELRARRGLVRTFSPEWLLNFAYQALCDYGNSYMRPLAWLFVVFAAGTAIFVRAPIYCSQPMPVRLAANLSVANIFPFLPNKREIMTPEVVKCFSNWAQGVSTMQSLLSVVLLFLLGLALRNRFRMK